jgi:hypothetical protein
VDNVLVLEYLWVKYSSLRVARTFTVLFERLVDKSETTHNIPINKKPYRMADA